MFYELLMAKARKQKQQDHIELEYLESTGTQWIDTGVYPDSTYTFDTKVAVTEKNYNCVYWGTRSSGTVNTFDNQCFLNSNNSSTGNEIGKQIILYTTASHLESNWRSGIIPEKNVAYNFTGITVVPTMNTMIYPISLFGLNVLGVVNSELGKCRIYKWVAYSNNKLIADLIPVLDKNLEPCMYDKVSGKYFYNKGTGEFKWKLPNQLEYLESDGNQYLNLNYIPTAETGLRVKVSTVGQGDMIICGSRNDTNNTRLYLSSTYSSAYQTVPLISIGRGTYLYLQLDGSLIPASSTLTVPFNTVYEQYTNYKNSKVVRFIDDTRDITSVAIPELTFTPNQPLYLFAGNIASAVNYSYKGKIYSCEITEGDKVAMYLIPVYDKTLTPCMYDLVSKKYFYNIGTGQFKGCFEDGSQLINYLEGDGSQYIDSGVECTSDLKVEFKGACSTVVNAACCGGIDLTNNPVYFRHHWSPHTASINAGGHYSLNYWCQKDSLIDASVNPPYTLGEVVEVMVDPVNGQATVNGTEYTFTPLQDGLTTGKNYGIFARIANTGAIQSRPSSFSYFKIHKKSNLVRCFVPVLDIEGTPCMYDTVKEKYYNDENGVGFTYGTQVNLFDPTKPSYVAGYISTNNNGNITSSTLTDTFYIPCKPNTTYLVKRTSYKEANQVWRVATIPTVPTVNMSIPHYVGGTINDLYLVIKSRETDKYLLFSEGRTLHTDDLSKFTVLEIEDNNSLIGS